MINMIKDLLFSKYEIEKRISELAKEIEKDFSDEEVTIFCVLKGSFMFTSDLVKFIKNIKCEIEFIKASSYDKIESTGTVKLTYVDINIENKNVIIVEDILDTGLTLQTLTEFLTQYKPKTLKTCVLLDKKEKRKVEFEADYIGFEIPDKFVIGYGLDYDEKFRNLSEIYYLKEL